MCPLLYKNHTVLSIMVPQLALQAGSEVLQVYFSGWLWFFLDFGAHMYFRTMLSIYIYQKPQLVFQLGLDPIHRTFLGEMFWFKFYDIFSNPEIYLWLIQVLFNFSQKYYVDFWEEVLWIFKKLIPR